MARTGWDETEKEYTHIEKQKERQREKRIEEKRCYDIDVRVHWHRDSE